MIDVQQVDFVSVPTRGAPAARSFYEQVSLPRESGSNHVRPGRRRVPAQSAANR